MAAWSKEELLAVTRKEFDKLQQALEKVETDFAYNENLGGHGNIYGLEAFGE